MSSKNNIASNINFEQAFKDFYPLMVNYSLRFTRDLDTSRDIAQQVFINLYEKQAGLKINTSLKNYLLRSTRNSCINHIKAQKTLKDYEDIYGHLSLANTDTNEEEDERFKVLLQAIEQLPERCQEIFKMNRFEGLRNPEIAEVLGLSIRTVETQISKALKSLRTTFKQY